MAAPSMQGIEAMNASYFYPQTTNPTCTMTPGFLVLASGITVLIGAAQIEVATLDSMFAILTLAGALVASSTAFLVNPTRETVSVKIGRTLFSGAFGVVGSRMIWHLSAKYEWLSGIRDMLASDQIVLFGAGLVIGLIGLWISVSVFKTGERHAKNMVERYANWADHRYGPPDVAPQIRHTAAEDDDKKK